MSAKFKVIKIDPKGSGLEWAGHLDKVFEGQRCCKNCTIIFGADGNFGPFVVGELEPLNDEAKRIMAEVLAKHNEPRRPTVEVSEYSSR